MNPIDADLKDFRWRKTQRRLVTDKWHLTLADSIKIKGKGMDVVFQFQQVGVDPHTKGKQKKARIYKPISSSPTAVQDITLYVHI